MTDFAPSNDDSLWKNKKRLLFVRHRESGRAGEMGATTTSRHATQTR